jgi:hypothetical protein
VSLDGAFLLFLLGVSAAGCAYSPRSVRVGHLGIDGAEGDVIEFVKAKLGARGSERAAGRGLTKRTCVLKGVETGRGRTNMMSVPMPLIALVRP